MRPDFVTAPRPCYARGMSRSVGLPRLGAVIVIAALTTCIAGSGREDVAVQRLETALCEKAAACGCTDEPLECGEWPSSLIRDGSGAFDPSCVDHWLTWLDGLACGAAELPSYAELCPLYHGTIREGEPCERRALTETDCDRGLYCIAGTCRDPQRIALGEPSQPCELGERCSPGLLCFAERCERVPGAGEACLSSSCDANSRCDEGRCVALPGADQLCESGECRENAFCSFDPGSGFSVCRAKGRVGEPCRGHGECGSGNCPAGFCAHPAKVGDPCSNRLPCGPDQWCDQGVCVPAEDLNDPTTTTCELLDTI